MVSREALERLVLSALLQGSTAPLAVADGVQPQDFAAGPLRAIADAVYGLLNAGWRDRDRVAAVAAQLAQQGRLEEVGGVAELAVLAAGTAPDEAVERASAELIRRTDLERLADAAGCIAVAALAGDNPEKAWLASERALFEAIPRSARWEGPRRAKVLAYPAFAKIEWGQARLRGEHPIGPTLFPFGIRSLDERCEGLAGEELTLVLAPRGWARAIVHQAALAAASIARRRVIVAGDEPPTEFVSRALAWLGGTADHVRARGELKAGALDRLVDGARIFKDLPLEYVTPPVAAQIGSAWRARVDVREPRLLVITEVRGLGRGYRNALLRMRQLCRADGSRLLVALETDRDAAALDPFFPDARSRRVAELATRIVRFRPGPRRAGTLRVLDRKLGIEFRVRVGLSGPELRIVERSARGGSSRA